MAEPIVLLTEKADAAGDLASSLTRHGLPARVILDGVEIVSPREGTNALLCDIAVALEIWLDERAIESMRMRVGDRLLVYGRSGRYVVVDAEDAVLSTPA
jgi:hypothetical protein